MVTATEITTSELRKYATSQGEKCATWTRPELETLWTEAHATPRSVSPDKAIPAEGGAIAAAVAVLADALADMSATALDETRVGELIAAALTDYQAPESRIVIDITSHNGVVVQSISNAHEALPGILRNLVVGNHVFLVGEAGSGKTTLAEHAANALDRTFVVVSALLTKFEAIGYNDVKGDYVTTALVEAFVNGWVWIWDESDASLAPAVVAINAMLSNRWYTLPSGETVERHADFIVIACANTYGTGATRQFCGRNPLDEASRDRFFYIDIAYDLALEKAIAYAEFESFGGTDIALLDRWLRIVQDARAIVKSHALVHTVSPRASIMGARLMASVGESEIPACWAGLILKGAQPDVEAKLNSAKPEYV